MENFFKLCKMKPIQNPMDSASYGQLAQKGRLWAVWVQRSQGPLFFWPEDQKCTLT